MVTWPPCPYKVNTRWNHLWNQKPKWVCDMVCSIGNLVSTKFSQMMVLGGSRPTVQWPPCTYMVKHLNYFLELKGQWPWDLVCNISLLGLLYISFEYLTLQNVSLKIISQDWPRPGQTLSKRSCDSISDPGENFRSSSSSFLFYCPLNHMGDITYVFLCMHQFCIIC